MQRKDEHTRIEDEPIFLRILALIAFGVATPIEISRALGLKPTTTVKYLNLLRKHGYVAYVRKQGKNMIYAVNWSRITQRFVHEVIGRKIISKSIEEMGGFKVLDELFRTNKEELKSRLTKIREVMWEEEKKWYTKKEIVTLVKGAFIALGPLSISFFPISLKVFLGSFKEIAKLADYVENEVIQEFMKEIAATYERPGAGDWLLALRKLKMLKEAGAEEKIVKAPVLSQDLNPQPSPQATKGMRETDTQVSV